MLSRKTLTGLSTVGIILLASLPIGAQENTPAAEPAPIEEVAAQPAESPASTAELAPADVETAPTPAEPVEPHHGCKHHAPPPPNWSLGAGIGYYGGASSSLWYGLGTLGYDAISATAPSYGLSIERRLGDQLWLTLNGSFAHVSGEAPVSGTTGAQTTVERSITTANLAIGARYLLIKDIVDVSVHAKLGGTYSWLGGKVRDTTGSAVILGASPGSYAYALGGTAGLTIERRLIERLGLRFSADVLEGYWTTARVRTTLSTTTRTVTKPNGSKIGLAFTPSLELRLYF